MKVIVLNIGIIAYAVAALAITFAMILDFKDFTPEEFKNPPYTASLFLAAVFFFGPITIGILQFMSLPIGMFKYLMGAGS
jgi:hypothetical protein